MDGFAQPPAFAVGLTQPPPPAYELSGWWRRVGASVVDSLIVGVGYLAARAVLESAGVLGAPFTYHTAADGTITDLKFHAGRLLLSFVVDLAVVAAVTCSVMAHTDGQSIGKMATDIRVVREDGEPVTFGFAALREILAKGILFGILAIATLFVATVLNYLWPLWDDKRQALHDKLVGTRVVRAVDREGRVEYVIAGEPPRPPAPPPGYPTPPPPVPPPPGAGGY